MAAPAQAEPIGRPRACSVKQVLMALIMLPLAAGAVFALLNWLFRRRGSNFSLVASVISQWLVMYLVWTLVGGLLQASDIWGGSGPSSYTKYGFGLVAVVLGLLQYRLARAGATTSAARVFFWSQIGWLLLILVDHGVLG